MGKIKGMSVAKNTNEIKNGALKKLMRNGQILVNIFEDENGKILMHGIYTDPIVEQVLGKGKAYKVFDYEITDKQTNAKDILDALKQKGFLLK